MELEGTRQTTLENVRFVPDDQTRGDGHHATIRHGSTASAFCLHAPC
jgi:hypothetical protein